MAYEENVQEISESYYFVPDPFDLTSGIHPVRIGKNRAKPGYRAGPRMIDYYSLHFVRGGKVKLMEGGKETELAQGDIFCLFPERLYSYAMIESDAPLEMSWVAFDGVHAAELIGAIPLTPDCPVARGKLTPAIRTMLHQLLQLGAKKNRAAKAARIGLLYQLFGELTQSEEKESGTNLEPELWIRAGIEYMKTHFKEPIGVRHAAEHVNIHRAHFTKLFTEHVGVNPSDYLRRLRMEHALHALRTTHRSILDIALSIGYADTASFSRAFRNVYGCPPSAMRGASSPASGSRIEKVVPEGLEET